MKQYIYDETFDGLLTAIFYAYASKQEAEITRQSDYVPHLLLEPTWVTTEVDKADRVYNSILKKLSHSTLRNVYHLFLSDLPDADTLILKYLKLCYTYTDHINLAKNNAIIILVDTYCRRVSLEVHRYKGFVRFREVNAGIYYAKIEPDHHILPLVIKHFKERFSDQYFIIHDLKREVAIVYNLQEIFLRGLSKEEGILLESRASQDEFEQLFKSFYTSVNIKERKNIKQQLRYMPKRYHKHLVEL